MGYLYPKNEKEVNTHPQYALEYWKVKAFFEADPTIKVSDVNDRDKSCILTVDDPVKAMILEKLLKVEALKVIVKVNGAEYSEDMIDYLCKDNPHYNHLEVAEDEGTIFYKANMFNPDVMHYYSDDMFSPSGHTAILPYQLAKMVFKGDLNYQTELR